MSYRFLRKLKEKVENNEVIEATILTKEGQ